MESKWNIREPVPDDAAQMLDLLRRVGGETDNLLFGAEGMPLTVEQERQYLEQSANGDGGWMYVAEADGVLVGTASLMRGSRPRIRHRAELSVAVAKSHWGQGVGSALLTRLIEAGKSAGVTAFTLEVRADNAAAIHLYEKLGFHTAGRLERYLCVNGEYCAALVMELYV